MYVCMYLSINLYLYCVYFNHTNIHAETKCNISVSENTRDDNWILGVVFLEKYYSIFDMEVE